MSRPRRVTRSLPTPLAALAAALLLTTSPALAGPYTDPGHEIAHMAAWAAAVMHLDRGPLDIAAPGNGDVTYGVVSDVLGPASGGNLAVLSLGDGGTITLLMGSGIIDGPGDDFAVFENAFYEGEEGLFAELAFVEVSSNGSDFARFASDSLQATPVSSFAVVDPTDYDELAGKHDAGWGEGFDLADLASHPLVLSGDLDLGGVFYVRVVDVVGDGSTVDGSGDPIYDPYPTPFAVGGFDLDGIGVLNSVPEPGSLVLLGVGCLALRALAGRRRCAAGA